MAYVQFNGYQNITTMETALFKPSRLRLLDSLDGFALNKFHKYEFGLTKGILFAFQYEMIIYY